jgi:5-methylcytosine-specific restriction enzyme A
MSPTKPKSPCAKWPCSGYAQPGSSMCAAHRKEAIRQWEARGNRGTSAQRGYDARWRAIRLEVLQARPTCQHPDCQRPATEAHHIVPRRDGGPDTAENCLALCKSHHSSETSREKWKRKGREMTPAQTSYRPPPDEGPCLH